MAPNEKKRRGWCHMAAGDGYDVIKQPLFATVVLGLTGLFFVVTGVQYVLRGGLEGEVLRGGRGRETERENRGSD